MTELDVVNMALVYLGQSQLSAIEYKGATEPAPCARLFYNQAVKSVLRRHRWNFSLMSVVVCSDVVNGFYRVIVPDDCSRVTGMFCGCVRIDDFSFEGGYVVCQQKPDRMEYISNELDVDGWDALFVDCVALRLAGYLANAVCQSPELENRMLQRLEQLDIPHAMTADARESGYGNRSNIIHCLKHSLLLGVRHG
ncbi:MAG: hypothetical protein RR553_07800 [Akkermansia sp.]